MVKRCIYCNVELEEDFVVDICRICMYKVWGPKMSQAIISGMEKEKAKGNMELGRVGEVNTYKKDWNEDLGIELKKIEMNKERTTEGFEMAGGVEIENQEVVEQLSEASEINKFF